MKEEAIAELMKYLKEAVDFSKEQAPDVVKQMLTMGAFQAWFAIIIGISLLVVGLALVLIGTKKGLNDDVMFGVWFFGAIFVITGMIMIPINYYKYYKVTKCPKVYILEQLKK